MDKRIGSGNCVFNACNAEFRNHICKHGAEHIFMLNLNTMLLNRLDEQSTDIFRGIRFNFETLDIINGFAQLFRELFFALVGSRMDKEDNTCVLAHPLAVLHRQARRIRPHHQRYMRQSRQ